MTISKDIILTVVIPAYNAENTLERAVSSIVDGVKGHTVEIIVVNDGSRDGTKNVCEKIAKKNKCSNINILIVNQENKGHGSAINYGIQHGRGKYLRILDSDDYFSAEGLENLLNFLEGCDADLVINDYREMTNSEKNGKIVDWAKGLKYRIQMDYDKIIKNTAPTLLPFSSVRTDLLRNNNCKVDERCYYDDREYDFWIIAKAKTVIYLDDCVYNYVVGNDSQSISKRGFVKNIKDHEKVVGWLLEKYKIEELSNSKKKYVFENILVELCNLQYYIAIELKGSRKDFLSFDRILKHYPDLYYHSGVAGRRILVHRLFNGIMIKNRKEMI